MCRLLFMTIACLLIMFGISGLVFMPKLIQQKIEQRLHLKIGTKTFDRFTRVPIPLTVKFYLFNVTNSERVLQGLERPRFKEVGPFMYKQWRRREIVDFEDYNRRLRYREYKTFYPMFQENTTAPVFKRETRNDTQQQQQTYSPFADELVNNGELLNPNSVNVTLINLPLLSALTKLAQLEPGSLKLFLASKALSNLIAAGKDKILVTKRASEFLFDGYKVDFMESARDLVSEHFGYNFDSPLPRNRFGFFYNKNNTWSRRENGELTVFTGRNDSMKDFMMVDNWNDQHQLQVWPNYTIAGNRCNEIRGTDGSQFHPGTTRDQVLNIFSPMICTSIRVVFKEDTETKGIPLLRYTTPSDIFAAPRKQPRNACYCTVTRPATAEHSQSATLTTSAATPTHLRDNLKPHINDSRCYLDGLMDLSLCQRGAPIAASSPHFYNADPMLAMAAGLQPKKEIHQTYLDIEPMTGSVFRAASRAQLNAYVEQAALDVVDSSLIGNMTAMVAPLLWLEELGEIDDKSSVEFKNQLLNLVNKARKSFYYAIIIGCLIIVIVCAQYYYAFCYKVETNRPRTKGSRKSRGSGGLVIRNRRSDTQQVASRGTGRQRAANIVAASVALGASGAASSKSRRAQRQQAFEDDAVGEDQLSKRMLVADEWENAVNTGGEESSRAASSSESSSGRSRNRNSDNEKLDANEDNVDIGLVSREETNLDEDDSSYRKPSTSSL